MANHDALITRVVARLRDMDSAELQQRLRRGHFADYAIAAARDELRRRGITPPEPAADCAEPAPADSHDMVVMERRLNPAEAQILRSALEAGGVPAIVDDFNAAHYLGYLAYALDGVRVRVPDNHVERAREIMADIAANRCMLEDDEPAPESDIQEQRILAYTRDASFARKWRSAAPRLPGFMWSALIFGPAWFFYRKLYKTGAVLFGLEMVFLLLATQPRPRLWLLAFFVMRILMACTAEALYYARTRTIISEVTKTPDDESIVQKVLQQRGGISFVAGLGALVTDRLLNYVF
jgi:hypothetical protein